MYLETPTITTLVEAAQTVVQGHSPATELTVCIFLGEESQLDINQLIKTLNTLNIQFIGGIFPAVISGLVKSTQGAVVTALPTLGASLLILDLASNKLNLSILESVDLGDEDKQKTALILVDGLTANVGGFLSEIYDCLGNSVHYLGGGAGSLSLQQKPSIFHPSGYFQDAAIITFIDLESQLGVQHGWQRIKGPILATKTCRNVILSLNWQCAFDVYKSIIELDSGQTLNPENFFDISKGYPFGIFKEGQEDIVRDPIIVNDAGELICVGEVPENASLYILKGYPNLLINSARQAALDSIDSKVDVIQKVLIVDCISRVLFLEDDFDQELSAIQQGLQDHQLDLIPEGILTLGEISSYGEGFLEFLNKTIVVSSLY